MSTDTPDDTVYRVVISDEGRYSIWPEYREIPWGWRAEGTTGDRQACLDYIAQVWTDMRPLSLRRAMDGGGDAAQGH
ncbi:MbtH family protein [Methyloversatilis thermotolerans]|uniref:MbtH family protein n=1 Tax=Methyloversatilis thermotolerans TaxID=1346290 RepID=UPI00036E09D4|nr:MbtH family NRPS accessory protein [Methyloversatilis thermotolerans]